MSKFITSIPIDVESIKGKLPKGCFIHSISWNAEKSKLEITWEHHKLVTPYTFPVEFPVYNLSGKLPKDVRVAEEVISLTIKQNTLTLKKGVDKVAVTTDNHRK